VIAASRSHSRRTWVGRSPRALDPGRVRRRVADLHDAAGDDQPAAGSRRGSPAWRSSRWRRRRAWAWRRPSRPGSSELGGWRALFWGQALAGLLYAALAFLVLPGERGDPRRLRAADWGGYGLLSLALGLLVIGVSEGERRFWFETWWITAAFACGSLALIWRCGSFRARRRRCCGWSSSTKPTLGWALIFQLFFRFGLMFGIVAVPQFLARLQGYRVEQLGRCSAAGPGHPGRRAGRLVDRLPVRSAPEPVSRLGQLRRRRCARRLPFARLGGDRSCSGRCPDRRRPGFRRRRLLRFATWDINPPTQGPTVGVTFNYARVIGLAAGVAAASHTLSSARNSIPPA
jgi:DHA2 family multidrug resistance protein